MFGLFLLCIISLGFVAFWSWSWFGFGPWIRFGFRSWIWFRLGLGVCFHWSSWGLEWIWKLFNQCFHASIPWFWIGLLWTWLNRFIWFWPILHITLRVQRPNQKAVGINLMCQVLIPECNIILIPSSGPLRHLPTLQLLPLKAVRPGVFVSLPFLLLALFLPENCSSISLLNIVNLNLMQLLQRRLFPSNILIVGLWIWLDVVDWLLNIDWFLELLYSVISFSFRNLQLFGYACLLCFTLWFFLSSFIQMWY